jgi:eukaryotic-like serine/threonine-protein kinase
MSQLGTLLAGRYRLDAEIGRGGMSTVYRAFDTVLERTVAIKLMHREIAAESGQLERFRREARAVAQLNHAHIVRVIDAGEEDAPGQQGLAGDAQIGTGGGTPYIVFEYVEGETLKQLIEREAPLDISQAIAYAIQIARGLATAHEHLIVHRDVKPQNVLIDGEGSAKITDFGIARTLSEQGLTIDGRVLGTTDYVSPEQALGEPVTGQSDLYSLGIVLYEMLTGAVPFQGETPVTVAMRHVRERVPDVQANRPEASAATAAAVERATAVDLGERYPNAETMIADLEEALALEAARSGQATAEVATMLRTLPPTSRRRLPWHMRHPARWVASLAVLAAAIVGIVLWQAAGHTHRGVPPDVKPQRGLQPVDLAQNAAYSYNPFGNGPEAPSEVSNVLDGDPNTTWSTEHYFEDNLADKPGVGIYLDAAPGVQARALVIQTPTPGFRAGVYASNAFNESLPYGNSTPITQRGWTQVAPARSIGANTKITLNDPAAVAYRYYLIWIVALPPGSENAEISEVALFKTRE